MHVVYVAGGAGFIGSHLCEKLLSLGYEVVCLDNFITSAKSNIDHLLHHPQFHFKELNITNFTQNDLSGLPHPEYIFHLASPASPNAKSPRSYIAFPVETWLANTYGTYLLLNLAHQYNSRFLFASTSEVYGDPEKSPQSEDYFGNVNPNGVRSIYDESKRAGEAIVMSYVRKYHLDARIMRIFNTYGPHMQEDDGRVVSNFIMEALHNKPLTIYGTGEQTRSFCYVSDLVEGMCTLLFKEGLAGEVVNLGNPNERTIKDFALLVKELTHTTSEVVYEQLPQDDPKRRCPDITKAKALLSWEPSITLEEGLEKTIEYFRNGPKVPKEPEEPKGDVLS